MGKPPEKDSDSKPEKNKSNRLKTAAVSRTRLEKRPG